MPKIFISYRRLDSQDFTDRLFDYMARHFGQENVFQDVGDSTKIPPGVDFVEYLAEQVRACDVVLVVIGDKWVSIADDHGNRRLDNPNDFVRIEVRTGLERTQFSAFVGYLPRSRQALLRERLHRHLDEEAGAILILPIRSDDWWQRQEIRQDAPGDGISTVSSAAVDRPAPPALY
jgi:CRISPR/Cas system-associated endoribonuclease Cas2